MSTKKQKFALKNLNQNSCFELPFTGEVLIGRSPESTLKLDDGKISRTHAKVFYQDNQFFVEDLRSTNGTFVNNTKISSQKLNTNDKIRVGNTLMIFLPLEEAKKPIDIKKINLLMEETRDETPIYLSTRDVSTTFIEDIISPTEVKKSVFNQKLLTLYKISEAIISTPDTDELLDKVLGIILDVLAADKAFILVIGSQGQLEPAAVRARIPEERYQEIRFSRTIIHHCLQKKVAILSADASTDSRFQFADSIITQDIRSAMCVPLIHKGTPLGILQLNTQKATQTFSEDDLAFVTGIGNTIALAIENVNLTREKIKTERLAAVGQTIAGLSHYIKNIIQGIVGYQPVFDKAIDTGDLELIHKIWQPLKHNNHKISELVQNMLNYSRGRKPHYRKVSLQEIIQDALAVYKEQAAARNVSFALDFGTGLEEILLDSDGILRCLLNLISNGMYAIKEEQGIIEITTAADESNRQCSISIHDNGSGLDPETVDQIFDISFSTKGSRGTGLGLAVTKKIVEEHGGTIEARNHPNGGSEFIITLPLKR